MRDGCSGSGGQPPRRACFRGRWKKPEERSTKQHVFGALAPPRLDFWDVHFSHKNDARIGGELFVYNLVGH